MKNIFFFNDDILELKGNLLEQLVFSVIPLKNFNNPIINIEKFKHDCKSELFFINNIEELTDYVINVCENYLYPQINRKNINTLPGAIEFFINENKENFIDVLKKDTDYIVELKDLMVLSYVYKIYAKNIANTDERLLNYYNKRVAFQSRSKDNEIDSSEFNTRQITDKFYYFNKKGNYLKNYLNKRQKISSILDCEVVLLFVRHPNVKRNLFINDNQKETNIYTFCKDMSLLTLEGNDNDCFSSKQYVPDYEKMPSTFIFAVWNNFLLEQLSNLNFLTKVYKFHSKYHLDEFTLNEILRYANSPLISTRLKIMKWLLNSWRNITTADLKLYLIDDFRKIYHHQILCVIPIILIVFHYFVSLLEDDISEKIEQNINTYFEKMCIRYGFFKKIELSQREKKYIIVPSKDIEYPEVHLKLLKNNDYIHFINISNKDVYKETDRLSYYTFEKKLNDIINNNLINCLVEGLSSDEYAAANSIIRADDD